ncbi:hypothetical protein KKG31_08370 [Patescibacteria group bacterium]|nr:hypothetical protein [Patescibacteria group bacterium]MBU1759071.1 hypothetical protein [Patescibacteria group bacterium]
MIGGDGTTPDDCTDTSIIVIPTVYIKPTCSLTAYDDNGDVINGTVPVGTEGTLQCLLTNAAVLSASPYMFNIALNGQTINTPTWQSSNIFS